MALFVLEKTSQYQYVTLVGCETRDGPITETDAQVLKEILDGPHSENGEKLFYGIFKEERNRTCGRNEGQVYVHEFHVRNRQLAPFPDFPLRGFSAKYLTMPSLIPSEG